MGIPKRKSRPLKVRDHNLRWLRKSKGSDWGGAPICHDITVQHEDGGGLLQFSLLALPPNQYDPSHGMRDLKAARNGVTPVLVARVIEAALDQGWVPNARTKTPYLITDDLDLGPNWRVSMG